MLTHIKSSLGNHIKKTIDSVYLGTVSLGSIEIEKNLELPKSLQHGHLAFPVFAMSKLLKKAPPLIAKELAEKLLGHETPYTRDAIEKVSPVGGYVNVFFKDRYLQQHLLKNVTADTAQLGFSQTGKDKTLVIDYSSPNVAKPMSIGHLRATVIGQAIRNLAVTQGYRVIGINHLGDWGSQFGKMAWALEHWGSEYPLKEKPFESLYKMYVRFHEEESTNQELATKGAEYFRRLENGDTHIHKIWEDIRKISIEEYQRLYDLLGVKFELVQGEAFYNSHLKPTVERIRKAGILEESQGAQVVFVGEDRPPCIIMKSDGASLYATRDIASAIYRHEVLKGDEILYVVGVDQILHFQQVFEVLKKMGFEWAQSCHHIAFGMYRFKDIGRMSTRKGNVVFMEDVIERAIGFVEKLIEEKNPELKNKTEVAQKVGVGAIIFNDLMNDRIKNVDFDWDRVLDFEGDSGPYVQYCVVRCKSILKKYEEKTGNTVSFQMPTALSSDEERALMLNLLNYADTLSAAYRQYKPNILSTYLLDLCKSFNHFYHKHKILSGENQDEMLSRLALVRITQTFLEKGLGVLGIQAPEQM